MLEVIARDGPAVLVVEHPGDTIGAAVQPDGKFLVLPTASLAAHGDWEMSREPLPGYVPGQKIVEEMAALRRFMADPAAISPARRV